MNCKVRWKQIIWKRQWITEMNNNYKKKTTLKDTKMNGMLPNVGQILLSILTNWLGHREKYAYYLSRWGNMEEVVNP